MKFFRFGLIAIILVVLSVGLWRFAFNKEASADKDDAADNSDLLYKDEARKKLSANKPSDTKTAGEMARNAENRITSVKTKDLSIGASKKVESGNKVSYHVMIQLMDGKIVFNSRDQGKPWTGTVGGGSILNGIDDGIRGMFQGGKRAIWIPARFGYGPRGISGQVPPDSDLYAEVEIVSVF